MLILGFFLTPSCTTSYFPVTAAKYHLIFKSPSLSHTHPYNPLLITTCNVLFLEVHLFDLNVTHNVQALEECNIFLTTIYIIVLLRMINLKTLEPMEGQFTNFTFPSASALYFLV
jgi:hypothetical protein